MWLCLHVCVCTEYLYVCMYAHSSVCVAVSVHQSGVILSCSKPLVIYYTQPLRSITPTIISYANNNTKAEEKKKSGLNHYCLGVHCPSWLKLHCTPPVWKTMINIIKFSLVSNILKFVQTCSIGQPLYRYESSPFV